jgi:hypothetical protein
MGSNTRGQTMNKNAKWPNRQTLVNPAGIGVKREDFYFWFGDLVVICHFNAQNKRHF